MRYLHVGLCALLMFSVIGCGGDSVDAILREEKAILEDAKAGKLDVNRQTELAKRLSKLSDSQKQEYVRRKMAEIGNFMPKGNMQMPGVNVKVP